MQVQGEHGGQMRPNGHEPHLRNGKLSHGQREIHAQGHDDVDADIGQHRFGVAIKHAPSQPPACVEDWMPAYAGMTKGASFPRKRESRRQFLSDTLALRTPYPGVYALTPPVG